MSPHIPLALPSPRPLTMPSGNAGLLYLLHFLAVSESWRPTPALPWPQDVFSWKPFFLVEEVLSPTFDVLQNGKGGMYLPCSPSELSLSTFKNPSSFEELVTRPHDPPTYITLSFYQRPGHSPSFMTTSAPRSLRPSPLLFPSSLLETPTSMKTIHSIPWPLSSWTLLAPMSFCSAHTVVP